MDLGILQSSLPVAYAAQAQTFPSLVENKGLLAWPPTVTMTTPLSAVQALCLSACRGEQASTQDERFLTSCDHTFMPQPRGGAKAVDCLPT